MIIELIFCLGQINVLFTYELSISRLYFLLCIFMPVVNCFCSVNFDGAVGQSGADGERRKYIISSVDSFS